VPYVFDLTGGVLCLDFVNTLGDRPRASDERLERWTDLVTWAAQAGVLTGRDALAWRRWAAGHGGDAAIALASAKKLREALYRVFSGLAAGRAAPAADLSLLNQWMAGTLGHLRVAAHAGGFAWTWHATTVVPDRLLWPVVRSAGDLLVSPERAQLRECQSEVCSWLFVDRSRTKRRRWCSMQTCGNRAKVRRFQQRRRGGHAAGSSSGPSPKA
jgi:predicted RNA-binding Zn ribbon-like protein